MQYQALITHFWASGTFWVTVAVIIFFLLVRKKLAAGIFGILDARTKAIQAALDEATALKEEAQAMLADAKLKQAQANEDAKHLLSTAHAEAQRIAAEIAADAQAAAKRREQMALDRIKAAELSAIKDVQNIAIDVATAASAAFLRAHVGAELDAGLIDKAIGASPASLRG